jgi:Bacteriophage T4, Gp8.
MATKLVTNNQKIHTIRQFTESINEVANSVYYLFTCDHVDDLSTVDINDCGNQTDQVYANMLFGKRISATDVVPLINKYEYQSNTVYSMYDDTDIALANEQFYVMVDEGSFLHVYKCLDNNNDSPSTIQPTFAHIAGANSDYYKTSDGYIWKYMYTFDSAQDAKFSTENFIPVIANTTVSAAAVSTQIDVVKVTGEGRKYDNYLIGTFGSQDISYGGNAQVFQIANSVAKNSNGFYTDCVMYLSVGSGAGQFKTIQNYVSNNSGKFVILNDRFDPADPPTNGTEYQIYPQVKFKSSGHVVINAVARALVNALASNSIYRVEMLNKGTGYDYSTTATVVANSVVGVQSPALLEVMALMLRPSFMPQEWKSQSS